MGAAASTVGGFGPGWLLGGGTVPTTPCWGLRGWWWSQGPRFQLLPRLKIPTPPAACRRRDPARGCTGRGAGGPGPGGGPGQLSCRWRFHRPGRVAVLGPASPVLSHHGAEAGGWGVGRDELWPPAPSPLASGHPGRWQHPTATLPLPPWPPSAGGQRLLHGGCRRPPPGPGCRRCAPSLAPRNSLGCRSRRAGPGRWGGERGLPPCPGSPWPAAGPEPCSPPHQGQGKRINAAAGGGWARGEVLGQRGGGPTALGEGAGGTGTPLWQRGQSPL